MPEPDISSLIDQEREKLRAANPTMPMKLATVITTFRKWLYLPDAMPLLATLGTVAANLMKGDPVWLLLVGGASGGKTELLQALRSLPYVHMASTVTEASLLSGTSAKERTREASGGLLRRIGAFGILLCKDFTSVLAMNRDMRAAVLAALREIYDGQWTRHLGVDGGQTLEWRGKLGMIGACTSVIDKHHAVMASMGERFAMFRQPTIDAEKVAAQALRQQGEEGSMREELERAVSTLFNAWVELPPVPLGEAETARLVALATLAVRARSAVERDGYTREVDLIPEAEAPGRLVLALSRLLAGVSSIGAGRSDAWRVVSKVALDSVPALRLRVIQILAGATDHLDTTTIANRIGYPTQTTRRSLEDLTAHKVVRRGVHRGSGALDKWRLSDWTVKHCCNAGITFPEMSENDSEDDQDDTFPEMSESGKRKFSL
jgi:hypothetical protein